MKPEDSILRRHYEQARNAPAPSRPTPSAGPSPASGPAPSPAAASSPAASSSDSGGGGFFGWLKRLFGG